MYVVEAGVREAANHLEVALRVRPTADDFRRVVLA
jgi:hypothetical protein